MLRRLRQSLVRRFWDRTHQAAFRSHWAEEPVVRRAINRRISGCENRWPIESLHTVLDELAVALPLSTGLSLGSGRGALERDVMAKGLVRRLTGIDISQGALDVARELAIEGGLDTIRYELRDLDDLHLDPECYDIVFAHQSLHHVRGLEVCLDAVQQGLVRGGLFYIDEYVGPSRDAWRDELLHDAQVLFDTLPRSVRRRRALTLPVDWRDPSEAVRSSEILPLLEDRFEVVHRRDYGGNFLSVIYPHLDLERAAESERDEILQRIVEAEEDLLRAGASSFYSVVLATP